MADLAAVTAADVGAVSVIEKWTAPAVEAIVAGQLCGIDANGKACLADADTGPIYTKGIALESVGIGMPVTCVRKGIVDVGDVIAGLAFNASVFSSGTPGLMADAAVGGLAAIGSVVPGWGFTTADRLLRLDL